VPGAAEVAAGNTGLFSFTDSRNYLSIKQAGVSKELQSIESR
jgi:hypothetical protein